MFRLTEFSLACWLRIRTMGQRNWSVASSSQLRVGRVVAALAMLAVLASGSCVDSTGPVARGDLVVVGGGELNSLAAVSVSRGRVVARVGPIPRYKDSFALSRDSSRLYISSSDPVSGITLSVVDTRSLRVVQQEPMSVIGARSVVGPVRPLGTWAMAVSEDGRRLIVNGVRGDSSTWLNDTALAAVVVDLATLTPVGVAAPFKILGGGIVSLAGTGAGASQRVLLLGTRPGGSVWPSRLILVLGGPDFAVVDSLVPGVDMWGIAPDVSPGSLLLVSTQSIYRFDLATRQLVDSAPRPTIYGSLCSSPDGQRMYHTDSGDGFDFPGAGKITVYGQKLQPIGVIDLNSKGSLSPTLNDCAVSADGRFLFVSSGTGPDGPLFGPQPGRLFVVDRAAGALVRAVDIGDWLSREVFAF